MDTILAWIGIIVAIVALAILVLILLGMMHYGPMVSYIWGHNDH